MCNQVHMMRVQMLNTRVSLFLTMCLISRNKENIWTSTVMWSFRSVFYSPHVHDYAISAWCVHVPTFLSNLEMQHHYRIWMIGLIGHQLMRLLCSLAWDSGFVYVTLILSFSGYISCLSIANLTQRGWLDLSILGPGVEAIMKTAPQGS